RGAGREAAGSRESDQGAGESHRRKLGVAEVAEKRSRRRHEQTQRRIGVAEGEATLLDDAGAVEAVGMSVKVGKGDRVGVLTRNQRARRVALERDNVYAGVRRGAEHPGPEPRVGEKHRAEASPADAAW